MPGELERAERAARIGIEDQERGRAAHALDDAGDIRERPGQPKPEAPRVRAESVNVAVTGGVGKPTGGLKSARSRRGGSGLRAARFFVRHQRPVGDIGRDAEPVCATD